MISLLFIYEIKSSGIVFKLIYKSISSNLFEKEIGEGSIE